MTRPETENSIPQPQGLPVLGNMLTVDANAPLQALMRIAREQGPLFQLNMMGTPLVIASGHEVVEELCDESRFDKAVRGSLRRIRAIGGDGLFTGETQEPNWRKAHNILLPTFSQRAMVNYFPMMLDIGEQLVTKWERLNADDEIDVVHDMTAVALDTIGVCGFDYRFNSFYRRDYHPFIDALNRTLETCMMQRGIPFEDVVLKKRLNQMRQDVGFMNKLVDDIIKERKRGAAAGEGNAPNDLLNYMLAGVDKMTGEGLSDENIRYQINTFLIAGHETTSGLMSFTLYYLLNNPDVLERAREEVDRVLGRDISVAPTFQNVGQLTYVQQVLKEALRLWPTAPAFGLYPYQDEVIAGRYRVKKRTFMTVLTLMLHRDTAVWGEDAEAFNPDNFSREAEAARPVNAYKPFGNGQRACIGRQFALQEAVLVIAMILQRFELVDHANYQLSIKESLSIKPDGFTMKVKPRAGRMRSALAPVTAPETAAAAPEAQAGPKVSNGVPLLVLYGSNLGSTEEFAELIANRGALYGFETSLAALDEHAGKLPKEGGVIIATASYNGAPPDNAVKFADWLASAPEGAAKGVHYAVFGCGNRDWASTFQATPRLIDEALARLGGVRMAERGEGDAREDMDGALRAWMKTLWPAVGAAFAVDLDARAPETAEPLYDITVSDAPVRAGSDAEGAFATLSVAENRELLSDASKGRSTRHIAIRLPEAMGYRPGDHLAVLPINSDMLANRALTQFGFSPDTQIAVRTTAGRRSPHGLDGAVSAGRLMKTIVDLQAVATRRQVQTLAAHTRCPRTRAELEALAAEGSGATDRYRSEIFLARVSVLDLLQRFPACELPFNLYLEMLPSLGPRYYSISSAPQTDPGQCSITVSVVEGPARSGAGVYRGVCSNYLAHLEPGNTLRGMVKQTKAGFRLPDDPARPVIMIGPGTGLAPFRGFLEARAAPRAAGAGTGPAMLFFGCRSPEEDYLYRDELEAWAAAGLMDLSVAFSRHGPEKVYVQDLIRKRGGDVWRLIEAGATIYVCGDGSRMEPDVKRALAMLHSEQTDADAAASEIWIEELGRQGRYVLDVWAGG